MMEENAITLHPPAVALFDQIEEWLWRQAPTSDPTRPDMRKIGIGATALCLRWGTYLATLLDESKPLDPHARLPEFSMILDNEMKRINIWWPMPCWEAWICWVMPAGYFARTVSQVLKPMNPVARPT
jgi:hypothetical protein